MSDALFSSQAECAILGAILVEPAALNLAEDVLRASDFGSQRHRRIFSAMVRLSEDGQAIDLVSLRERLSMEGALIEAGGVEYLASLVDGMPRGTNVTEWAEIVHDKSRRRQAKALGERLAQLALSDSGTEEILDKHANDLQRLLESGEAGKVSVSMPDALKLAEKNLDKFMTREGVTGIPSGLPDLDRLTGGWQQGTLVIVAARPAGGKSVLCGQMTVHAAMKGYRGLVFSMEMPPETMAERMWLAEAGVDKWDLPYKSTAWPQMQKAFGRLADLPITFDRRESPSLAQIRAAAKRERVRYKLDFVVVDYLQRIEVDPKLDNWIAIGETAKGLKSLSRMLNIPVIVACQLNRSSEGREPGLADLAESGKIEREADVVLMLHPDPETKGADLDYPVVHAIVAKHRQGACRRFKLSFEKRYARLLQMADHRDARAM